jgi:hypothetical protein
MSRVKRISVVQCFNLQFNRGILTSKGNRMLCFLDQTIAFNFNLKPDLIIILK